MNNIHLTIAVCTARRPEMLRVCLRSLAAQDLPQGVKAQIVVVENDPISQCSDIVGRACPGAVYVHEPRRGIPIARNRAVQEARKSGSDWLLFIDDDGIAQTEWVLGFLRAAAIWPGSVYRGPVRYVYPESLPAWFQVKEPRIQESGAQVSTASTNNVMISRGVFSNLLFDESFDLTGGEDTEYFMRARTLGHTIVWVQEAAVSEIVSLDRITMRSQLERTFWVNAVNARIHALHRGAFSALVRAILKALGSVCGGLFRSIISMPLLVARRPSGQALLMQAFKHFAASAGTVSGLIGLCPTPYKNIYIF
jgi:succinoglycan biosynthesis protein ExoM